MSTTRRQLGTGPAPTTQAGEVEERQPRFLPAELADADELPDDEHDQEHDEPTPRRRRRLGTGPARS
ncbi:hypothetical protein [Streptomyces sp. NPDC001054]